MSTNKKSTSSVAVATIEPTVEQKTQAFLDDQREKVLVLRTCNADMTARHNLARGFIWPEDGYVEAPDWDSTPECGHGLHGLMLGIGDYSQLSDAFDAKWLVVEVIREECVEIANKVKFPRGFVRYAGGQAKATAVVADQWIKIVMSAIQAEAEIKVDAKDELIQSSSDNSSQLAASGYYSQLAASGEKSIAAAVGLNSIVSAGPDGCIALTYWDEEAKRFRMKVGYIGEDGLELNIPYRLNDQFEFAAVK